VPDLDDLADYLGAELRLLAAAAGQRAGAHAQTKKAPANGHVGGASGPSANGNGRAGREAKSKKKVKAR
jgi:hypothetical protein